MGQTQGKQVEADKPKLPIKSTFKPKKYLSRVELVSLQYIFKELKSTFSDGFTCIEAKKFLVKITIFPFPPFMKLIRKSRSI